FQAEDGIRDKLVTGVQTCALPIYQPGSTSWRSPALGMDLYRSADDADMPIDAAAEHARATHKISLYGDYATHASSLSDDGGGARSEERRVGKEGRCGGWP